MVKAKTKAITTAISTPIVTKNIIFDFLELKNFFISKILSIKLYCTKTIFVLNSPIDRKNSLIFVCNTAFYKNVTNY